MGAGKRRRVILASTAVGAALVAGTSIGLAGSATAAGATKAKAATGKAKPIYGGTIKYAEGPGTPANYIFPETSTANQSLYNNSQFINLMYQELYQPSPTQPTLDYNHSMAYQPVWSSNDTVATVKLKNAKWSDGVPVTARDLTFYINLAKAMGTTWGNYAGPTQFPYNLKSVQIVNPKTIRFTLKSPMNPTYYDDNGIGYITPLPQHAWDKTSPNGKVGNYDQTPAGAKAVLAFLQKQAANTSTYASNPLWKVVDGAWTLQSFGGASSPDVFVPNKHYWGPKPYAAKFEEIPFTSDTAEFTSLKAGTSTIDYGYVPTQDIPAIPSVKAEGYNITKVPTWGFDYIIPNTRNPQVGPILSQTYIRQVLARLTDQNTMITHFMSGYGIPTYGATPVYPKGNPFVSPQLSHNPYPYSVSGAEKLLKAHGWKIHAGGVDVCVRGGAAGCGAGVAKGQKLSLNLLYSSGNQILQEDTDLFQSDARQAGVQINPRTANFNTVISQVQQCILPKDKNAPTCQWQLGEYGGISQSTFPGGFGLLNTGGAFNAGGYSNAQLDKYIAQSTTASSLAPYMAYENLTITQEPWIWQPVPDNIFATAKNFTGYGDVSEFDGAFGYIEPQYWYFTK